MSPRDKLCLPISREGEGGIKWGRKGGREIQWCSFDLAVSCLLQNFMHHFSLHSEDTEQGRNFPPKMGMNS